MEEGKVTAVLFIFPHLFFFFFLLSVFLSVSRDNRTNTDNSKYYTVIVGSFCFVFKRETGCY